MKPEYSFNGADKAAIWKDVEEGVMGSLQSPHLPPWILIAIKELRRQVLIYFMIRQGGISCQKEPNSGMACSAQLKA